MSQVNNITKWLGIEEENFKILSLDKDIDKKGNEISVVMAGFSPYMSFVNKVFPNAKIILDRFHLMQLFSRAFNKTKIEKMSLRKNKKSMNYKRYRRY